MSCTRVWLQDTGLLGRHVILLTSGKSMNFGASLVNRNASHKVGGVRPEDTIFGVVHNRSVGRYD